MVQLRLHSGFSAAISPTLITGNRCATSRDLLAGQNLASGDSEPIPQAMRKPHPHRNSGRPRFVTAGAWLPCDLSDHTSLNQGIDLPYHQRMSVDDDDENLNDFSYDEY